MDPCCWKVLDAFVEAVKEVFPQCLLQWEDLHKDTAFAVLHRYRNRISSFNDDIQGTAAVALSGILAALRITGGALSEQRIVYAGAGAAGVGIGHLVKTAIQEQCDDESKAQTAQVFVDSRGLLHRARELGDPYKRPFALTEEGMALYRFDSQRQYDLLEVVRHVEPTVLIGTTACPGTFNERVVREMSHHADRPIILPLSNPTSRVECTPAEAIRWSEGRAIVTTGTAFEPISYEDKRYVIGQANNVFVFPGVGLACVLSGVRHVTDNFFLAAAKKLADCVSQDRLDVGAIFPDQTALRQVSAQIATAVMLEAKRQEPELAVPEDSIDQAVSEAMWYPEYSDYA
jgi:malic enzyme